MGVQKGRRSGSSKLKAARLFLRRISRAAATARAVNKVTERAMLSKNKRTSPLTRQISALCKTASCGAGRVLLEQ